MDGVFAASRADFARVAGETVGEIDSDPLAAGAPVRKNGAACVGFGGKGGSSRGGQGGHRLTGADGEQGSAPELGGGLEQGVHIDVEGAEADPELVERLPI